MRSELIPDALDGERIDRVVALVTGCSRAEAVTHLASGQVRIDGEVVAKASQRVHSGETVTMTSVPERPAEVIEPDPSVDFDVVHSDDDVIVVDKPAGLVVHPGSGRNRATLAHGLLARFPELDGVGEPMRPGIVHRLDRGTSGLLVVARTPAAYEELVRQLSEHEVSRVYTALAWRHFDHPVGVIDAPISRSRRDPTRMTVALDGRESRTHYRQDREFEEPVAATLLTCELETGRTHQIRVHLASIGHPVVGDEVYGGVRHSFRIERPFLHARRLGFVHPGTGEPVAFDSPLPAELVSVLDDFS